MQEIKEHFSEEAYRKFLEDADDGVENEMLMKIQMRKFFWGLIFSKNVPRF